jgi:hypothetical protein
MEAGLSNGTKKTIRLSQHALGHVSRRGFTEAEVEETIRLGTWRSARAGRWEAVQDFPYNGDWNGTHCTTKRVQPVFVENTTEIVVVTVYTYFFS